MLHRDTLLREQDITADRPKEEEAESGHDTDVGGHKANWVGRDEILDRVQIDPPQRRRRNRAK
jgi:hypothetical protein